MVGHLEVGYLVRAECCDHVHPEKGKDPWVDQTTIYYFPTPIASQWVVQEVWLLVLEWCVTRK